MEYELSDTQMADKDASNDNMTTGITGVPTQIYKVPDVDIDK